MEGFLLTPKDIQKKPLIIPLILRKSIPKKKKSSPQKKAH